MNRRQALVAVGAAVGFLHGKEVSGEPGQLRGLTLALDAVDAIVVQYRGQRVVITPQDIMEALGAAPVQRFQQQMAPPDVSQYPRGK